jgi:hypothetical protein
MGCGTINNATLYNDEYVGFGNYELNIVLILISIFGIIINSIFVFNYMKSIITTKNQNNMGISAMEKMLCMIAMVETFISICWLLNNLFIQTTKRMVEYCSWCKVIAHFEIFLYLFDWMVLSTSLYQIRLILLNPQKILESGRTVIKFVIISFCISLVSFFFSIFAKFGGVSPMRTCFIRLENLEPIFQFYFFLFFTFPLFCFVFAGYQIYLIISSNQYKTEKKNRQLFTEYSYFVITNIIFSVILILSYILAIFGKIEGVQFFFTFLSCSNPLIVGLIRVFRTGLFKRLFKRKKNKNKNIINDGEEHLIENEENEEEGRIFAIEKKMLENLIIKYFTAISYALGKSKYNDENEEGQENTGSKDEVKFEQNEHVDYKITKSEILKDLDLAINEDIKVLEESNIDIDVTEYNSSTFKKLRELEGLNEDKIISMFQPRKGTNQLINKVKETLYINSTNKLLMLKKIKLQQLIFYQRNILPHLYLYLVNHPNSLICRVFGLYKIKIDNGEDTYMALMYNTNESLEIINNNNLLKPKSMVKQMKVSEAEIRKNIIVDSKRNFTIDIPKTNFNGSIIVGGGASDSNSKAFKLNIPENEETRLNDIIDQDSQFLREKNVPGFSFLVFERNVEGKERLSLFKDEEQDKNKRIPDSKIEPNLKKYIVNSNMPNVIYSICILGYRNKL